MVCGILFAVCGDELWYAGCTILFVVCGLVCGLWFVVRGLQSGICVVDCRQMFVSWL